MQIRKKRHVRPLKLRVGQVVDKLLDVGVEVVLDPVDVDTGCLELVNWHVEECGKEEVVKMLFRRCFRVDPSVEQLFELPETAGKQIRQ